MIEIRGDKKVLVTPVSKEDLADIKIGDIVWLDGDLMTCRDVAHRRLVEYGRELPYDIRNKAIFHAGPIVRKIEGTEDDYEMVSVATDHFHAYGKIRVRIYRADRCPSDCWQRRYGTRIPSAHVKNLVPSTVYSRQAVPLWQLLKCSTLRSITGMNLECRKHSGAVRSKNLARSSYPLMQTDAIYSKNRKLFIMKEKKLQSRRFIRK